MASLGPKTILTDPVVSGRICSAVSVKDVLGFFFPRMFESRELVGQSYPNMMTT